MFEEDHGMSASNGNARGPPDFNSEEGRLAWFQSELTTLASSLEADQEPANASRVLHRLLAVTAASNARISATSPTGRPIARRPEGGVAPTGEEETPEGDPLPPASASPFAEASAALSGSWDSIVARWEAIAATLQVLVERAAQRVGANSYSIGVSFPAGVSVTVNFVIPEPGRPTST